MRLDLSIAKTGEHKISIHAPLAGCDAKQLLGVGAYGFQSTHPLRGATASAHIAGDVAARFQSTHPLRGATVRSAAGAPADPAISIHAPLAGCDREDAEAWCAKMEFQSTHPLRGATPVRSYCHLLWYLFQSTHPLRGATFAWILRLSRRVISIHAPLAGCDAPSPSYTYDSSTFQSTHPLRGATSPLSVHRIFGVISIHAPLAGCDIRISGSSSNPQLFQSTHPLRGATTVGSLSQLLRPYFNPRTPCGVRQDTVGGLVLCMDFNPRTPCGVRQVIIIRSKDPRVKFQSTHPLRGATILIIHTKAPFIDNFNPRTPCGVRLTMTTKPWKHQLFQSTHPLRGATIRFP